VGNIGGFTAPCRVILRWGEVAQNDPALLQCLAILATDSPSFIFHTVLTLEKDKMSQSFSQNTNSLNYTAINVSNNFIAADHRSSILSWLSPLDPKSRHQDIQERRVENIGEWLLQTEEFRSWHAGSGAGDSANTALFCYGDPGVGKTFIR